MPYLGRLSIYKSGYKTLHLFRGLSEEGRCHFILAGLLHILDEHRCTYEAEHVKQSLARLELAFILSRVKQHYTFCVPIFKNMVLEQEPELLLEKECSGL